MLIRRRPPGGEQRVERCGEFALRHLFRPLPVVVDATVVRELLRVIEDVDVRRADRAERARDYPG